MEETLIKVENLSFKYGREYILQNINLEIKRGEFAVIIGPRGEGKSTFLKILAGLTQFNDGNVFYNGMNLRDAYKKDLMNFHKKTSFVFQDSALISNMDVFNNIALPLRYRDIYPEEEIQRTVVKNMEYIGLQNILNKLPAYISTGQAKLTALIRAIIVNPETIFYDEPIANLDKPSIRLLLKVIKETIQKHVTSLVITHQFKEFEGFIDKVIVLKDGSVYKIGTLQEIRDCKDEFINSLIE